MAASDAMYLSMFVKYAVLAAVAYFVTNYAAPEIEKNNKLLIAFTITIVFAMMEIYSNTFGGLMAAICRCPSPNA